MSRPGHAARRGSVGAFQACAIAIMVIYGRSAHYREQAA